MTIAKKKPKKSKNTDEGVPLALSNQSVDLINDLLKKNPLTDEEKNLNMLIENRINPKQGASLPFTSTVFPNNNNRKTVFGVPPEPRGSNYKAMRENLPIFPYRQEILDNINKNQVIVISGETGKSMQTVYKD